MTKKIEKICANCRLFNEKTNECSIVIIHEGEKIHLPVDPKDSCFFEETYFDPITKEKTNLISDVQQIKIWVENEDGEKTDKNGKVKIEYPVDLFKNLNI